MLDNRGIHANRGNSIDEKKEAIKNHIESFPKTESHYCCKEPQRQYLGSDLNLEKMYYLYKEKRLIEGATPSSITTYKNIFNYDYNLGFHHGSKDIYMNNALCLTMQTAQSKKKRKKNIRNTDIWSMTAEMIRTGLRNR